MLIIQLQMTAVGPTAGERTGVENIKIVPRGVESPGWGEGG